MRRRKHWLPYSCPTYTRADKAAALATLRPSEDAQDVVRRFEAALAGRLAVPQDWVLCTNSGTAALAVACRLSYEGGWRAPVLTWPSTYSTQTKVQLVDVDKDGLMRESRDPDWGVVGVELWGRPLSWGPNVLDAAQNLLDPRHKQLLDGGLVRAVAYSFGPLKQISCVRGGAVVSPYARTMEAFIDSGTIGRDAVQIQGYNFQMGEFNAAIGLSQLERWDEMQSRRLAILAHYRQQLAAWEVVRGESGHLAVLETASQDRRDRVRASLLAARVRVGHHYPLPLHVRPTDFPVAHDLSRRVLTLPCHLNMTLDDADYVVRVVRAAL